MRVLISIYIASIVVLFVSIITKNITLLGIAEVMNFTSLITFAIIYNGKSTNTK